MKFSPDDYLEASGYRIRTARKLYNDAQYSAAVYFAGVSIECLLRAFIIRENSKFDGRHDLQELYKKAQLEAFIQPEKRREVGALLGEVWSRWKNNYRFASDDRLEAEYRKIQKNWKIKGEFLKANSAIVVNSALELRTIGARRWNSKKN